MHPRFAESYVENLLTQKDLSGLHHSISVVEKDRELPKQCWLFCRLLEWEGSIRSGVWQYYEGIPRGEYERIVKALDEFAMKELVDKYRNGMTAWNTDDRADGLDKWIDANQEFIVAELIRLVDSCREALKTAAAN
jgi:hypothetical protein